MQRRGQLQLSFGMIFSIIIIAAVVLTAGYLIWNFVKTKDCTEIRTFYKDLGTKIESVYQSEGAQRTFEGFLPSSITHVCLGSLTQPAAAEDIQRQDYFKQHTSEFNLLFYPAPKSCGKLYYGYKLSRITTNQFFCVPTASGKAKIKLSKASSFDALVTVCSTDSVNCGSNTPVSSAPSPIIGATSPSPSAGTSYTDINVCQRAEYASLCDGLRISYTSDYKTKCCSEHGVCC